MNRRIIITITTIRTNPSSSSFLTAVSSPKIKTAEPSSGGTDTRKKNRDDNSFPLLSINADVDDTTATNNTNNKRVSLVLEVWEEVFSFDACKKLALISDQSFQMNVNFFQWIIRFCSQTKRGVLLQYYQLTVDAADTVGTSGGFVSDWILFQY